MNVRILGAHLGWGAQLTETEDGPKQLKAYQLIEKLNQTKLSCNWEADVYPAMIATESTVSDFNARCLLIRDFVTELAGSISLIIKQKDFPVVLGGDHAIAIGTWSGITTALKKQCDFGLLWIDAHMDAHTPTTSHSMAIHGMPLAALLGFGDPKLTNIYSNGPKISAKHLCLIGVRSYEPEERAFLDKIGVKYFEMELVQQLGFEQVFKMAQAYILTQTSQFGISIDLDAFDPSYAPGVGSLEPNGILPKQAMNAFSQYLEREKLLGIEIAEYNPSRDENFKTAQLAIDLLEAILTRRFL